MKTVKTGRYRYYLFSMIVLLSLTNYVDRGTIAFASGPIISLYGFDRISWGQVLGYFGYGYMFGALVGGTLSDRLGPRRVWLYVGGGWSVFEMATAFAGDFGLSLLGGSALAGFAVVRILFGFAEGPTYSLINRTMANWATPRERGFAFSLALFGVPVGAMLSAPISVGLMVMTGSWRAMFVIIGVVSLVLLAIFMKMFTDRPEAHPRISEAELREIRGEPAAQAPGGVAPGVPMSWKSFFTSRVLICNTIGYFSFQYVLFMILSWVPTYLQQQFHFSLSSLWYIAMIPWIGPCFSVIIGGRLSDWLLARTGKIHVARGYLAAAMLLLTTVTFLLISRANSAATVLTLLSIGNALCFLANPVFWAVVIDTSRERTGTFSGIMHMFVNMASVIAPVLTGYLSQRYGFSSMFVATSIVTFVGMVAMCCMQPGKPRAAEAVSNA